MEPLKTIANMSPTSNTVFSQGRSPRIAVIGAGLAGLTAAYRLFQKGLDVHVYEARSRVGGRVLSAKVGGHIAELGGQNITDGAEAKNMRRLIEELGLGLVDGKVGLDGYYFSKGEWISIQSLLEERHFQADSLKALLQGMTERCKNMQEVLEELFEGNELLYKILSVRLSAYEGASVEKLSSLYTETLYHMLLGGISSAHQVEDNSVDFLTIKGGNGHLLEQLAQRLGSRVHLNHILKAVTKEADDSYLLQFEDDHQIKADILLLAIPCSVFSQISFDEHAIPAEQLAGIRNVQYGNNAKILLPHFRSISAKVLMDDHVIGYMDAAGQILTLYHTGEASKFCADTIADVYRKDILVRKGFDVDLSLAPPVVARDISFASYEEPVGHSWPNDPFAGGSYSYVASGQEVLFTAMRQEQGELVKALFAPVNRRIYFAGEHASILTDVPGTMEAACESGERAAHMISLTC